MNFRSTAVYAPVRWNSAKTTTQPSGSADPIDDATDVSIDMPDVVGDRHAADDGFDAGDGSELSDQFI